MWWLAACTPDAPDDTDARETGETGVVVEWPVVDDWDAVATLVVDGDLVANGASREVATAPAGLDEPVTVDLVVTNRGESALAFTGAWLTGDGWALTGAPTSLAPGDSAYVAATFNPLVATVAGRWPAAFAVPGTDLAIELVAVVPRPLRVVVSGDSGWWATSDDYGLTWSQATVPTAPTTRNHTVTWGNGRFFRGDADGFQWTSPGRYAWSEDGQTWTPSTAADDFWVSDCAYGLGRFACVRSSNLTWSVNGPVVVHEATDYGNVLNSVVFVDDQFIAVGRDGRRRFSEDGLTWALTQNATFTDDYSSVVYGDGVFVAVGGRDRYAISTSDDGGATWTDQTFGASQYAGLGAVAYVDGLFLASGVSNSDPRMQQSVDGGVTWTAVPGLARNDSWSLLGTVDGAFIGYRADGLYRSTDGQSWDHVLTSTAAIRDLTMERWP